MNGSKMPHIGIVIVTCSGEVFWNFKCCFIIQPNDMIQSSSSIPKDENRSNKHFEMGGIRRSDNALTTTKWRRFENGHTHVKYGGANTEESYKKCPLDFVALFNSFNLLLCSAERLRPVPRA